jgi:molybdenum cofactor cytidylyltransferase
MSALNLSSVVFNPNYEKGMSTSVQAGLRALPPGLTAAGIFLVDQPLIDAESIWMLASKSDPNRIVLPVCEGRRGHPVFFGANLFEEILALQPDQGLNTVVRRVEDRVLAVPVANSEVLRDIDTPEEFEKLLRESQ